MEFASTLVFEGITRFVNNTSHGSGGEPWDVGPGGRPGRLGAGGVRNIPSIALRQSPHINQRPRDASAAVRGVSAGDGLL